MGCNNLYTPYFTTCERRNPLKDPKTKTPPWLKGKLKPFKEHVVEISFAGKGSFDVLGNFNENETLLNYKYLVRVITPKGEGMMLFKKIKKPSPTQTR